MSQSPLPRQSPVLGFLGVLLLSVLVLGPILASTFKKAPGVPVPTPYESVSPSPTPDFPLQKGIQP
jgi:hypothetical protein